MPQPAPWPEITSRDSTLLDLERTNDKIQAGLLGFGALHIMLSIALAVMVNSFITAVTLPELQQEMGELASIAPLGVLRLLAMGGIGIALLVVLGAAWQARNTHMALQNQLRWPGHAHAEALRKQIRVAQGWLLAAKIIPTAFVALNAVAVLFGATTTESPLASAFGYVAGQSLTLLLNWLSLNAISDWLRAVSKHTLGSKSMIFPAANRVSAWFIAALFPLGMQIIGYGFGIFAASMISPSNTRKMGLKSDLTAAQTGLFSQMSGSMMMTFVLGIALAVLCMLLLIWSRQLTLAVTNRFDVQSASSRMPAGQQHGAQVQQAPQASKTRRLGM